MQTNQRIGAYYQTSLTHMYATKLVLTTFRRVYPSGYLFAHVDDDGSHQFDWNAYHPIYLLSSNASVRSAKSSGMHFQSVKSCVAYVSRIIHAAQQLDWLILLEDDVWVCNSVNTEQLAYDMNGQCIAKYDEIVWGHTPPGKCYGGCGGFILRGSFLRGMQVDERYIHTMLEKIKRPIASDELLSALFFRSNGTIGDSSAFAERMTSNPVIVHQIKNFYRSGSACTFK
jgi:hypothetical protein